MKFVIIATRNPEADPSEFTPEVLEAEAKMALGFMAEDFVRELYSRTDGRGAVIVVEAEDEAAVEKKLGQLPLAVKGLLIAEIYGVKTYRAIAAMAAA